MRFLRRSLVGLFLTAVTFGLLAFAGNSVYSALETVWNAEQRSRPARERVFAVNTVTYQPDTLTPVLTSFGEVRSRRTLEVRATASGTVVDLADAVEEGGAVIAGDRLLKIDPTDAEAALALSRTDLAEAEAERRDAGRALELARDDLEAAEQQLALRSQALKRQQDLASRGLGTEASVETAALAEASARQSVLSKRQALALAEARLDQARNALARNAISVAEAERALANTEIFAEFSGTLSGVSVVQGRLVQNNEQIASLVDPDLLEVAFRISTSEYARLLDEDGDLLKSDVRVVLDIPGVDLETKGVINRESAAVGAGLTGRQIFARIDTPRGFRPGDFVTVLIEEPPLAGVARLPATALDAASTVLVIDEDDRLEVVPVELMRRQGDDVIVRAAGLTGRSIVAERSPLLGEGIKVRPLSAASEPAPPAMVELSEERRARLVAFVESNQRMPQAAKDRVLSQLAKPMVPVATVERIEARMGG